MAGFLKNVLLMAVSTLVILLMLEIALRFMPVRENTEWEVVDEARPIARHRPNSEVHWSKGAGFALASVRKSNNEGFLNDQDYFVDGDRPLIAVVGDSFVEAMMVPYQETLYGRLAAELGERGRVYSFGTSSAPLSQYLALARWAGEHYRPDALVIPIIANDFDESFYRYKRTPGFHYFVEEAEGAAELQRVDYEPNFLRRLVLGSALGRYVFYNLQAGQLLVRVRNLLTGDVVPAYVGNVPADVPPEQMEIALHAAELFLASLPEYAGLPKERILLLVSGVRPEVYQEDQPDTVVSSYWGRVRTAFIEQARAREYEVVDMHAVFRSHYREHGRRFEFAIDGHWNGVGHGVAAEQVLRSTVFSTLFPDYR